MKLVILLLGSFLFLSVATPVRADGGGAIGNGLVVYKDKCLSCHGEKGDGTGQVGQYMNPRPRNLVTANFKNGDSEAEIYKTVTEGLKGTGMAPFEKLLTEAQRKDVAAYVHSLRKK